MKKLLSVCIILLLFSGSAFGQTKGVDTLEILDIITESEAIEYSEPTKALILYKKAFDLSKKNNYHNGAFKASLYAGLVQSNIAQYDSALYYYKKAEDVNKIIKSSLNEMKVSLNRANSFMFKGELESSIKNHLHGIHILEERKDSTRLSDAYVNLSAVYLELDDYDKQIELLLKSLKFTNENNVAKIALTNSDLVLPYLMKKDFVKAEFYIKKADSLSENVSDQMLHFFVNRNWGEFYLHQDMYEKTIPYYITALKLAQENNYTYFKKDLFISLGDVLLNQGHYKEAEAYINSALDLGREGGLNELTKKALFMLSTLHERNKDYQKAYGFMQEHNKLKDSMIYKEKIEVVNALDKKYQTEKKDKEIAEQQLALSDQKLTIQESKSKTRTMTILIVSLLFGSILLWFSFNQRQKRMQQQLVSIEREQEVRTLESLMEGEEKERLRIAKELHDGVNGDLSAIKFKLSSLLEMNNTVIKEAVTMIDNSCEQVRAISHNLVPPSLKDFNLLEAVEEYCQSMDSIHEPEVNFQQVGEDINLDKKQEANLFRIVQELVTNSIKHAEGNEINVQLSHLKNTLQLTVEDNGKGFDPKTVKSDGIGMQNVQSRVDYLNATMDFVSNEKGTSYTITMDTKTKEP